MKVGLVGNGRIARRHVEALGESELFELVGIAEEKPERRASYHHNFDGPYFESLPQLMDSIPDVELLTILVESGRHRDLAIEALGYNVPVLVEKPMALSASDANLMVNSFEAKKVPLFVVKQNRLNPAVRKLLSSIEGGSLGNVLTANASVLWCRDADYYNEDAWRLKRNLDGGVVWNQASHYVDLLVLILGQIESVFAYGKNFLSPAETEDTVFAVLRSESGALGSLQATTTFRPSNFEGSLTVSGHLGYMRVGGHALNEVVNSSISLTRSELIGQSQIDRAQVYGLGHASLYADIAQDIHGKLQSQFRASAGLAVVEVMEAIEISILEGREVKLSEIRKFTRPRVG